MLDTTALVDEAKLVVERDCGRVMREDAEAQLVQASLARPPDCRRDERRTHAAPAPLMRDHHADLAKPERSLLDAQRADDDVANDRDQRPIEFPASGLLDDAAAEDESSE